MFVLFVHVLCTVAAFIWKVVFPPLQFNTLQIKIGLKVKLNLHERGYLIDIHYLYIHS